MRSQLVPCLSGEIGSVGRVSTEPDEVKGHLENASGGGLTLYGPSTQVNMTVERSEELVRARERCRRSAKSRAAICARTGWTHVPAVFECWPVCDGARVADASGDAAARGGNHSPT